MGYKVGPAATAIVILALVLVVANFCYGLIHETAHAIVVKALGGEVFALYVNPVGLDAYVEHSPVSGTRYVVLELAGLCATTIVAVVLAVAGKEVAPAFFALRTAIYAVNYAPGTDAANLYATVGNAAFAISAAVAMINVAALVFALRHRLAAPIDLFSSLSRGRLPHNSGE